MAYNIVLKREPDADGWKGWLDQLDNGLQRNQLVDFLRGSEDCFTNVAFETFAPALHIGRCQFIRSLPPARRILDLGGVHLHRSEGALVALGYPYSFEELVVVDLPDSERHELYRGGKLLDTVDTPQGKVRYRYHSMTDLSAYPDETFDLVFSGQSFEHIEPSEADELIVEISRVLRPGGWFALDTPNARATRLQQEEFIDPDHKVEYTHRQLMEKLERGGLLEVVEAKGINYLGDSLGTGQFSLDELMRNPGIYWDAEDCYVLAYVCRAT